MPWFEWNTYEIRGTITEFSSWSRQITIDNNHTLIFPGNREVQHFLNWMQVERDSDVIGQRVTLRHSKDYVVTSFS